MCSKLVVGHHRLGRAGDVLGNPKGLVVVYWALTSLLPATTISLKNIRRFKLESGIALAYGGAWRKRKRR
ncbi:MAG: hypothetical protein IPJ20_20940 [Flammeovirgaceae bacterium]|nr:hypothetical protein [Flammeovirgaceae bacterium]